MWVSVSYQQTIDLLERKNVKAKIITILILLLAATSVHAGPPIGFIKGQVKSVRALLKIPVKDDSAKKKKVDDQPVSYTHLTLPTN